jgi:hypothetical protein
VANNTPAEVQLPRPDNTANDHLYRHLPPQEPEHQDRGAAAGRHRSTNDGSQDARGCCANPGLSQPGVPGGIQNPDDWRSGDGHVQEA